MHFIAALDVGTTTVRCFVLNENCEIKGSSTEQVELLNPKPGYFEIDPESLWPKIIRVIENAVRAAHITPSELNCLGICTQRCTFLTWNHQTHEYYHNFITWQDLRGNYLVDEWNSGLILKTLNGISYILYLLTRSKRFLAGSVLKMMNGQVTLRLLHEIQNNKRLKEALRRKEARIELLDSWILYKLRSGNDNNYDIAHISDITSCTATGLFDPFLLSWSPMLKHIFGIETSLLPQVVSNSYKHFGYVNGSCFKAIEWQNTKIPITASMSDQTAAILGSQCFNKGDVKITLGTGGFLDLITGQSCHASVNGLYPLVAWQFDKETIFCVEGAVNDIGTIIDWGQKCGLFVDPCETSCIAESVTNTDGVYFIPAFSGLGPPLNDHKSASGFIGVKPSTQRSHLIRALLESIVYRLVLLCETAEKETEQTIELLKVAGGVSRNNFICQYLADASGKCVERAKCSESSIMGTCYLAGCNFGLWNNFKDVSKYRIKDCIFKPCVINYEEIKRRMEFWLNAVDRFRNWYIE